MNTPAQRLSNHLERLAEAKNKKEALVGLYIIDVVERVIGIADRYVTSYMRKQ